MRLEPSSVIGSETTASCSTRAMRPIALEVEAQLFFGLYESAEIRLARGHLAGANVVIDLGSSLGIVASHILSRMTSQGHLVCVEANPSLIESLRRTTLSHARGQRVDIVQGAIHHGENEVFLDRKASQTASRLTDLPSEGDRDPQPDACLASGSLRYRSALHAGECYRGLRGRFHPRRAGCPPYVRSDADRAPRHDPPR